MKNKFFKKSSFKTVLLFLFLLLSIVLISKEVFDQVKLSKNREMVSNLTSASLSRKALLTKIRKGCDYVQVHLLMYMFKNFDAKSALILNIMHEEIIKNDSNLLAYKLLITNPTEEKLFQNLVKQRRLNSTNRLAIIKLIENNKIEQAKIINSEVLFKSYEKFEQSVSTLNEYVNTRDHGQIEKVRDNSFENEKISIKINFIIFILMGLVGTAIVKLIIKLKQSLTFITTSEYKYKSLVELTTEIIETTDCQGKFIAVNEAFKKTLEFNDNEISKLTVMDILAPESKHLYKPNPSKEEFGEVITGIKKTLLSKSGKRVMVEGNMFLNFNKEAFENSTGFYSDVTQRVFAENSLIASEKKYRELFNVSPVPMWVVCPVTLEIVQVNKAALNLYGYTEAEFLNLNFNDIDMMTDNTSFIKPVVEDKGKNQRLQLAQNHRKKNGEKIDLLIVSQLFEEAGEEYLMIVGNDITERNLNLKSLKEQNEKLKEIAWIQSHIVRAPLARIMGLVYIINDVTTSLEEKTDMLKHVLSSAYELDKVIKDIVLKAQMIDSSIYD